jgi:hypothetical protein
MAMRNIELFAAEVLPSLQRLFPEEEHENRWWPKRLLTTPAGERQ